MIFDWFRRWRRRPPGEDLTCREAVERIYEFLDGELEGVTREEVQEHFRVCTRCYPHLALERSFREAVCRATRGREAPPELRERVRDLLAEQRRSDAE